MGRLGLFRADWLAGEFEPRVHAYYFKQWQGFDMVFHRHDSTEIMYVMSGVCRVEIRADAGGKPDSLELKRGEFVILNANAEHRLIVEGTCRMLNVEFGMAERSGVVPPLRDIAAGEDALREMLGLERPFAVLRDADDVYYTLKSLVLELDANGMAGGALAQLLLIQLLIRIARLRPETADGAAPPAERYVKSGIEYMAQHYDQDIQVKDVAAAVNLHPGYLQRIFRQRTGRTITEYLTALRIEKAKMLLHQTVVPVSDISDYVGVGSRQYFHALFKKHTGLTPVEYRRSTDTHRWTQGY